MSRFEVSAFGETMLRYSVGAGERLGKLKQLEVHVGGAETNVLAALASLNRACTWVSALPEHALGDTVLRDLRAAGIDTSGVIRRPGRVGTYYVEFSGAPRGINVIYDRAASAVTQLAPQDIDWDYLLDTRVLHLTGITPALSPGCHAIVLEAVQKAQQRNVTVSFDVNYRSKLWPAEEARKGLEPILHCVDILICGEGDAETVFGVTGSPERILYNLRRLSPAKTIILTRSSAGSATLQDDDLVEVEAVAAEVVDRLGAGDAFSAGVLDGFLDGDIVAGMRRGSMLSALALTQHGDMISTSRQELNSLMAAGSTALSR